MMQKWSLLFFAVLINICSVGSLAQHNYGSFVFHSKKPKLDWKLQDVEHTDQHTVLVIDIYSLDNNENCFAFYQSSYITVNNLSGALRPVKWTINGTERPLDDPRCFFKNSKGKYLRNKLYFPRIPVGYDYFNFYMRDFISWKNIYAKNANATRQTNYTEQSLREHWNESVFSPIEGIYQCIKVSGETKMSRSMRLGIMYNKETSAYDAIVINAHDFWSVGEVIGELVPAEREGLFKANYWLNRNKVPVESRLFAAFNGTGMAIATDKARAEFVKLYPVGNYDETPSAKCKWSGTGWAIGNGYLVTNNHVAEGPKNCVAEGTRTITVYGIDGNFNVGYSAEVVSTDKVNDIAILKINDNRYQGYGTIPYGVSARVADVGEDVFVLGFPLGDVLGDEIKLTNGIINSRTGGANLFPNCYQIQAPITNGNSGGPMFDSKGNVIGIVVGGLKKELNWAENVGYAIKTSYLKIMIESASLPISFSDKNSISNLSLPEKVKRVKNFVFYIECSK
ncbi:MAG: trypsin-like peptidase domain-containing protein [Bacteroidales bacterium]|nr:trypsin-like peptidase domain-containing protein [Bacteroidales bacterium]